MQDNISVGIIFKISNLQEREREREMEEGGREEGREKSKEILLHTGDFYMNVLLIIQHLYSSNLTV